MKSLPCFACAAGETGASLGAPIRTDIPFVNALAAAEVHGAERVRNALCASHGEMLRSMRELHEGRANAMAKA
jgi:hypothetical protein